MKRILLALLILFGAHVCQAAIINVPGDSATIQAGINGAQTGDTVLVADGTYAGNGNRDMSFGGKNIVVMSENGPGSTIIDCEGSFTDLHRAFRFVNGEDSAAIVEGFSIINGFGPEEYGNRKGGAIYCYVSSPTIVNCVFDGNFGYENGGAVATFASSITFIDCEFMNNFAIHGGAVYFNGLVPSKDDRTPEPKLINCVFHDNIGRLIDGYGGAVYAQYGNMEVTVSGCLFYDNQALFGGAIGVAENCVLYLSSSSLYGNYANTAGGIFLDDNVAIQMQNCIIAYNQGGSAIGTYDNITITVLTCSDIFGNIGGDWEGDISPYFGVDGNICLDPMFCDTANANYRISLASPCSPYVNSCGLMGAGGLGCAGEEFPLAVNIGFVPSIGNIVTDGNPEIFWSYIDTLLTGQAGYEIEVGDDDDWSIAEMWSTGQVMIADTSVVYAGLAFDDNTVYHLRIRVYNGMSWGSWVSEEFSTHFSQIIKVPGNAETIQGGIDLATHSDTVLVESGIYTGEGNRDLDFDGKSIVLMSESGPDVTYIDCQGSDIDPHRAFRLTDGEDSLTIIEGFTVVGGYGPVEASNSKGGALYCYASSPTVKNCVFDGNLGYANGGAVATFASSPTFIDCTFKNNFAIHGGGVYFNGLIPDKADTISSPRMINCVFNNNDARASDGYGGAVYIQYGDMELMMDSCLLTNNSAAAGGGIGCGGGSNLYLQNCTLAGNSGTDGGGIWLSNEVNVLIDRSIIAFGQSGLAVSCGIPTTLIIQCTDIYGNAGGDWIGGIAQYEGIFGNISLDPLFCDTVNYNYALDTLSPCAPSNPENECGVLIGSEPVGCEYYVCGDANNDEIVNVSDAVYLLNYIFVGGPPPTIFMSADANCDGVVNVSDVVHVLNYIFMGGNDPCDTDGDDIPDC